MYFRSHMYEIKWGSTWAKPSDQSCIVLVVNSAISNVVVCASAFVWYLSACAVGCRSNAFIDAVKGELSESSPHPRNTLIDYTLLTTNCIQVATSIQARFVWGISCTHRFISHSYCCLFSAHNSHQHLLLQSASSRAFTSSTHHTQSPPTITTISCIPLAPR